MIFGTFLIDIFCWKNTKVKEFIMDGFLYCLVYCFVNEYYGYHFFYAIHIRGLEQFYCEIGTFENFGTYWCEKYLTLWKGLTGFLRK